MCSPSSSRPIGLEGAACHMGIPVLQVWLLQEPEFTAWLWGPWEGRPSSAWSWLHLRASGSPGQVCFPGHQGDGHNRQEMPAPSVLQSLISIPGLAETTRLCAQECHSPVSAS